ncbi:hypothetical protein EON65_52825 [archaeon]|nr:MAG: hypothetical protein EON65_52825 [archaeon]
MISTLIVVIALVFCVVANAYRNELVLLGDDKIGEVVKTRVQYKSASELPTNWDYREKGLLTADLNQHIPVYW